MKDQLARLSASSIKLGMTFEGSAITEDAKVVTAFELWFPKDERQRVLWPTSVQLSAEYFQSLTKHAVPLDEHAIGALAHSAMALDVYAWLAEVSSAASFEIRMSGGEHSTDVIRQRQQRAHRNVHLKTRSCRCRIVGC